MQQARGMPILSNQILPGMMPQPFLPSVGPMQFGMPVMGVP
jgi:hypothetical protein